MVLGESRTARLRVVIISGEIALIDKEAPGRRDHR